MKQLAVLLVVFAVGSWGEIAQATEPPAEEETYRLAVNMEIITMTGSADGGMINRFAHFDFRVLCPLMERWNPFAGFGMGLLGRKTLGTTPERGAHHEQGGAKPH